MHFFGFVFRVDEGYTVEGSFGLLTMLNPKCLFLRLDIHVCEGPQLERMPEATCMGVERGEPVGPEEVRGRLTGGGSNSRRGGMGVSTT